MPELQKEKNPLLDINSNINIDKNNISLESEDLNADTVNNDTLNFLHNEVKEKTFSQLFEEPIILDKTILPDDKTDNIPEPNCLALTVRKDYNITIIKNIFTKTGRMSLKVALSTLVLNFLRMIF